MGKKGKEKKALKEAKKLATMYTEDERRIKISNILLEIAMLGIDGLLTDDIRAMFQIYIKTGKDTEEDYALHKIQRTLVVRIYGSKGKKSYINLKSSEDKPAPRTHSAIEFEKKVNDLKKSGIDLSKNPQNV